MDRTMQLTELLHLNIVKDHKYDDHVAEKKHFKNYGVPFVQLEPKKDNFSFFTYSQYICQKKLLENGENQYQKTFYER